ncbi:3-oxoacyl-ACP reductase FabG [Carboxydocella sp. JDF658]|uniref:3-oxoacyl-ACP reductase FabG n=1 Tax=Carboxydocella sp. JDF658 TaxID=1926600 RepID=UPI0009ADB232|nr:3-oxoacyl-ACP reductase FabG [Carboxydocella sp. JDF658]GAW31095.1 beta-ketoacyl-ACP reductase [Carboxydocella sp. JDF658]
MKVALVTGASGTIGRAIAQTLAAEGWTLALHYNRGEEAARELARSLQTQGQRAEIFAADLRNQAAILQMVLNIREQLGPINALINNAGVVRDALLHKMELAQWQEVLDVHLNAAYFLCQQVLPDMISGNFGRIINIASIVGQQGRRGQANYAAAKAALFALTKSLALETAQYQISVNAICPPFVLSEMSQAAYERYKERILSSIPRGFPGQGQDVANLTAFLCRPENGYITGQIFNADCRPTTW